VSLLGIYTNTSVCSIILSLSLSAHLLHYFVALQVMSPANMTSNFGTKPLELPKLNTDGSNIILYKEHLETWLKSHSLSQHLSGCVKCLLEPIEHNSIYFWMSHSIMVMTEDKLEAYKVTVDA
jgi:hypothetical protein